jgi:hypothetical protein
MIQELWWFITGNADNIALLAVSLLAFAEVVVRLTPTKTDDGAVKRVGEFIDKALTWFPNNVKRKSADEAFKKE